MHSPQLRACASAQSLQYMLRARFGVVMARAAAAHSAMHRSPACLGQHSSSARPAAKVDLSPAYPPPHAPTCRQAMLRCRGSLIRALRILQRARTALAAQQPARAPSSPPPWHEMRSPATSSGLNASWPRQSRLATAASSSQTVTQERPPVGQLDANDVRRRVSHHTLAWLQMLCSFELSTDALRNNLSQTWQCKH